MISRKLQIVIIALVVAIFAMGFYLVHLKRKAESTAAGQLPVRAVAPPLPGGPAQQLILYLANDEADSLTPAGVSSPLSNDPGERARMALHELIARYQMPDSAHVLGAGADVREVYLLDANSAVVDLSAEFASTHRSGIEVEELSIFSMVLTLRAQQPSLTRVRFLVDGKSRETLAGHFDIEGWIDAAAVEDAARALMAPGSPATGVAPQAPEAAAQPRQSP